MYRLISGEGGSGTKNLPANEQDAETWVRSLVREDPLEEEMATQFLPGESHGWRSLAGCSPLGSRESVTTEHTLYLYLFSLFY